MIDTKTVDLVNRDLDGVTSPEEHQQVQSLLQANGEVRRLYDDLQRVAVVLSRSESVDPPIGLKPAVLRAIGERPAVSTRRSLHERLEPMLDLLWNRQTGIGFAFGVAAGLILLALVSGPLSDLRSPESDLTGTMMLAESDESANAGTTIDISHGSTHGLIRTSYTGRVCIVHIAFRDEKGAQAEFVYDPATVRLTGFRPASGTLPWHEIQAGRVAIVGESVDGVVAIFETRGAGIPVVQAKIHDADGKEADYDIPLTPPEGKP